MTPEDASSSVRWVIEAALPDLQKVAWKAGLDPNSVERDDFVMAGREPLAYLGFPTFFCPEAGAWLAALAHLTLHGLPFRLFQEARDETGHLANLVQLYPCLDRDMIETIAAFSTPQATLAEGYGALVEEAFARLRREVLDKGHGSATPL